MPIYEFKCDSCLTEFDKLVCFNWRGAGVTCPVCGSADLKRIVSRVAASRSNGSESTGDFHTEAAGGGHSCSSCSGGTCSTCH